MSRKRFAIGDTVTLKADLFRSADSERVCRVVGVLPAGRPEDLGDASFRAAHRLRYAYLCGAMANGIASPAMVSALARAGYLASYGAAGVTPGVVDAALAELTRTLPGKPFACNLIHSPSEPALERAIVDSCLRHEVRCVEASAFMGLTAEVVRYRIGPSVGAHAGPGAVGCFMFPASP